MTLTEIRNLREVHERWLATKGLLHGQTVQSKLTVQLCKDLEQGHRLKEAVWDFVSYWRVQHVYVDPVTRARMKQITDLLCEIDGVKASPCVFDRPGNCGAYTKDFSLCSGCQKAALDKVADSCLDKAADKGDPEDL